MRADQPDRAPNDPPAELTRRIRLRRRRLERAAGEAHRSIGQDLAQAGVIGWTIATPAVLGVFAGRWLDRRLSSGIACTLALLLLGISAGCVLAWQRVRDLWSKP